MLTIVVPATEEYDELNNEFKMTKEQSLVLEHSLVSISKWESLFNKPFLSKETKTNRETIDYIKTMTVTQNVDDDVYNHLTQKNINDVLEYIDAPMTATTFGKEDGAPSREIITSEIIYYWMITFSIPMECQRWHLNRLLTLIKVCSIKNQPKKHRNRKDIYRQNRELNELRRKQHNTTG